jgi:mannitol/fructose-specific phosphotransferase system IIA component
MGLSFFSSKNQPELPAVKPDVGIDTPQEKQSDQKAVLVPENIRVGLKSVTKDYAIEMAGQLLVEGGYVTPAYIAAMQERETVMSTYVGEGVAIPHGVGSARDQIRHSGICILQFPEGIEYTEGEKAYFIVGIAGKNNQHLQILSILAEIIQESDILHQLFTTTDREFIYRTFINRL